MCLIITLKHDTPELPDDLILGVYNRNRDGIGVMWAQDDHLHYEKILPKDAKEALEFYRRLTKGKTCAVHFRLRTHGAIDYENCHPYEVFGFDETADPVLMPMLLMHNGVLHTGNHRDTTKSDTWHYVRDYLHKLLAADPSLAFTPEFAAVIGKHIGNNRFVLMNHQGDMAIINKDQGVEYKGAWMSNTYAWEYARFVPPVRTTWGESRTSWVENRKGDWVPAKPTRKPYVVPKTPPRTYQPPLELEWDIREVIAMLDEAYPDNDFTPRQAQTLVEELGTTMVYVLMDDLTDGKLTRADFEKMLGSRLSMRAWLRKNTPVKEKTP